MTSKLLENLKDCTSKEEARVKCTLFGERFDGEEWKIFSEMENWQKTLYIYDIDCMERNIENVLR